jgi:hypothetical protein
MDQPHTDYGTLVCRDEGFDQCKKLILNLCYEVFKKEVGGWAHGVPQSPDDPDAPSAGGQACLHYLMLLYQNLIMSEVQQNLVDNAGSITPEDVKTLRKTAGEEIGRMAHVVSHSEVVGANDPRWWSNLRVMVEEITPDNFRETIPRIFEQSAVEKPVYHGPLSGLKYIAKDVANTAKSVGMQTAVMYAASGIGVMGAPAIATLGFTPAAAAAFAWKVGAVHLGSKVINKTHAVLRGGIDRLNVSEGTHNTLVRGLDFGHGVAGVVTHAVADRYALSGASTDEAGPEKGEGSTFYGDTDGRVSDSRLSFLNPFNWTWGG